MPTEFALNMALLAVTPAMGVEATTDTMFDFEEKRSSHGSTPIPGRLSVVGAERTESATVVGDAADVVLSAGKIIKRLSFLPTDPQDEAIVDALVSRRMADKKKRKIRG